MFKMTKKHTIEEMGSKLIIEGLGGKRSLSGSIEVFGAKNAALKALASSILFPATLIDL